MTTRSGTYYQHYPTQYHDHYLEPNPRRTTYDHYYESNPRRPYLDQPYKLNPRRTTYDHDYSYESKYRRPNPDYVNHNERAFRYTRKEAPTFGVDLDPEAYIDWEADID